MAENVQNKNQDVRRRDPFADSFGLSDEIIHAFEFAESDEEKHFVRVMNFHGNMTNGGFNQALFNHQHEMDDVLVSYAALNLNCLVSVICLAAGMGEIGSKWQGVFNKDERELDAVYCAITYNLAYVSNGNSEDNEFETDACDWVDRMGLKYARKNRDKFEAMSAAIKRKQL